MPQQNENTRGMQRSVARWTNLVLGCWLFVSAFIWQHTVLSRSITLIGGAFIALTALAAMSVPAMRYVNCVLAAFVYWGAISVHHLHPGTGWHNEILAVVVFLIALAPGRVYGTAAPRPILPARRPGSGSRGT